MKNVIEIENLTKYYGKARGIVDVSFSVAEGEIFGFIGPNGAGKSTTIRILLNLIYPTSGGARVFGRDCVKDGYEIRRDVGYLPSEVFYYDDMKVLELLKYSASFYGRVDMQRLRYLAEVMELDLGRKIDDLSYGNKKKVGIVQGLLHRPSLIILDEPTGGLDPLMQQRFFGLIREENRRGATVLFSSHILPEVQKLCSRVGIIREGKMLRVEEIGSMRDTAYKKIRLEFREEVPEAPELPEGAGDVQRSPRELAFLFRGDINEAFKSIARFDLRNAVIEEPDLEEIFLHYYGGEDGV
ncbi:ABC transporter ATP-binding protein [Papillibacter cinnamivorans]|uniref:ABC-2 type transport system ATP-binding protein n=1 Tax=Papillibacter cinnamivorans DSM 12816 TaxID=1122930 RepID=A0A1W2C182_9FIRM|nr:ABC transporter ATP-binding protein [Papillibacter cinnamivorans]SMC78995.1 ABC-2 type transport system ATP-binding protein [Papillibacter cinnamivorans DSM 12816]